MRMVLTSAWVSDSARRKQPFASCVKVNCPATAPPIDNLANPFGLGGLLVAGKGEIMFTNWNPDGGIVGRDAGRPTGNAALDLRPTPYGKKKKPPSCAAEAKPV